MFLLIICQLKLEDTEQEGENRKCTFCLQTEFQFLLTSPKYKETRKYYCFAKWFNLMTYENKKKQQLLLISKFLYEAFKYRVECTDYM